MRIRTRIFLGICAVALVGFYFLLTWMIDDLKPQYRKATEEPLVDSARMLAHLAESTAQEGQVNIELFRNLFRRAAEDSFEAQIFDFLKTKIDFRVYITDSLGIVIFDSDDGRDEGEDYSEWRDVNQTLQGSYGARTSNDIPGEEKTSVMYVAAPIMDDGELIGVLAVGKPTTTANRFMTSTQNRIVVGGVLTCLTIILVTALISGMVTEPIRRLTLYARSIRDGARASPPNLGKSEIYELGQAFEEMREALEGKEYVENYIQTLTHEIKAPLSALQGAVELLEEDMPAEERQRFLRNVQIESGRIHSIVEKLLLLASLEKRSGLQDEESIDLKELVEEVLESLEPVRSNKSVEFDRQLSENCVLEGERFLLRHAVLNLVINALDFSPAGEKIEVRLVSDNGELKLHVLDNGPGIPDYAAERVFERFFSLKRPDTGKKSSGLGLSLVKEAAELHGGDVSIHTRPEGGTEAILYL